MDRCWNQRLVCRGLNQRGFGDCLSAYPPPLSLCAGSLSVYLHTHSLSLPPAAFAVRVHLVGWLFPLVDVHSFAALNASSVIAAAPPLRLCSGSST